MFLGNISAIVHAVELVFVYSDLLPTMKISEPWGGAKAPRAQSPECVLIFRKNRMCVNYRNQTSQVVYIKMLICSAP